MPDTREIVIQAQKDVIKAHGLRDWFDEYPWLTGFIGDIHAPVWFLAENPSLSQLDKQAMKHDLNENLQWNASEGDHLLREAITEAGLKAGDPKKDGHFTYPMWTRGQTLQVNEEGTRYS